jgi:hypothetical protein
MLYCPAVVLIESLTSGEGVVSLVIQISIQNSRLPAVGTDPGAERTGVARARLMFCSSRNM